MVEQDLLFVLKASYNSCVVSKFKPVHRTERVDCEAELFEFFVSDVMNKRVNRKISSFLLESSSNNGNWAN